MDQTNMHFTPNIFNITVWKVSSLTKPMILDDFVTNFFLVSRTVFEITALTLNLAIRCFPCVAYGSFTIYLDFTLPTLTVTLYTHFNCMGENNNYKF